MRKAIDQIMIGAIIGLLAGAITYNKQWLFDKQFYADKAAELKTPGAFTTIDHHHLIAKSWTAPEKAVTVNGRALYAPAVKGLIRWEETP